MMSITSIDFCLLLLAGWLVYKITFPAPRAQQTTRLNGPPSKSLLLGCSKYLRDVPEPALIYEQWAEEYGPVYSVPSVFGSEKIMLHDPKALLHFYSREGFGYNKMAVSRQFIETLFGRNLIWAEGETHKRQRKSLTPAFANAAVRDYTSIFYDSAYKLTHRWDAILESGSEGHSLIEVQQWMNRVSLDTIGLAGFSHDFQSLDGKPSVFDSIDWMKGSMWLGVLIIIGSRFPAALNLPSEKMRNLGSLKIELSDIADHLFTKGKTQGVEDKSVIGLLMKAEQEASDFHMSREEVIAQMNLLLLAGYETTSISLTWCLIELSLNTSLQDRLRDELSQFGSSDPTYEQLTNSLPYLDAVVLETLRTHPPVGESPRVAVEDDIIPLSTPITDKSGRTVDNIFIAKGTAVCSPIRALNNSVEFWGPDAKVFNPDRWLNGETEALRAKEIQGHRHLLTFIDGPRTCLGKQFALVEFKAVLSVLIRTYVFRLPGGKETEFGKHMGLLPRPKVMGMEGAQVPLNVRRV